MGGVLIVTRFLGKIENMAFLCVVAEGELLKNIGKKKTEAKKFAKLI